MYSNTNYSYSRFIYKPKLSDTWKPNPKVLIYHQTDGSILCTLNKYPLVTWSLTIQNNEIIEAKADVRNSKNKHLSYDRRKDLTRDLSQSELLQFVNDHMQKDHPEIAKTFKFEESTLFPEAYMNKV